SHLRVLAVAGFCSLALSAQGQEVKGGSTTTGAKMSASLAPVTQSMLDGSAKDDKNFLHPNGNYEQTRFYPASQINAGNVKSLRPAFIFQTAVRSPSTRAPRSGK